jgi:hypothetical protein
VIRLFAVVAKYAATLIIEYLILVVFFKTIKLIARTPWKQIAKKSVNALAKMRTPKLVAAEK